jgi:hypothetical protein
MTSERTAAYRRVLETLSELGPAKLLGEEQDRIRYAADNLIFSSDLCEDEAALGALTDIEQLCGALVESGRWELVTATRLADDLAACGPSQVAVLSAA